VEELDTTATAVQEQVITPLNLHLKNKHLNDQLRQLSLLCLSVTTLEFSLFFSL
jgi:hypothetical protein